MLVPIAVALVVRMVRRRPLCCCGRAVVCLAGLVYRLPVPVQPLKALVRWDHTRLRRDNIAAGALLMGMIFWCSAGQGCWIGSRKCFRIR